LKKPVRASSKQRLLEIQDEAQCQRAMHYPKPFQPRDAPMTQKYREPKTF